MTSRRRRIAGGIAALSLAAGLVLAGSFAAQAAPSAVDFTTGDHDLTSALATIEGTVAWDPLSTAGGTITLNISEADGDLDAGVACDTLTAVETTWSCSVALEYGLNAIRAYATAGDDPGFPRSTANAIQVTYGSADPVLITSPAPDTSTTAITTSVSGTGPHMGQVQVQARPELDPVAPFVQVCATSVDYTGAWTCPTDFGDYDRYTIRAVGQTNTAIGVLGSAEQNLDITPLKPTAVVTSTPDGGLESTTTADQPNQDVGARWTFWPASGTPQTELVECPAGWVLAPPPLGGPTIDCDVTPGAAGTYLLHGQGFRNDASSSDFAYLGRIPASPVVDTVTPTSSGVDVAGSIDLAYVNPFTVDEEGSLLVTVVVDGYGTVCTATPDVAGDWICDDAAAPGGLQDFSAYATTVGYGEGSLDGYFQGSSTYGNTVSATVYGSEVQILAPADGSSPPHASDPIYLSGTSTLTADVDVQVEGPDGPYACTATPDTEGDWSCNLPSSPTPPVGVYTVTASQPGSIDDVITFTRILPTPDFNGSYVFEEGAGVEWFGGQNFYGVAGTYLWIDDGPSCTSPEGGYIGWWDCSLDLSGLAPGLYPLHAQNFITDESELDSQVATATLRITAIGGPNAPALNCGFSPNGGFSVSGSQALESLDIYAVYPDWGSPDPEPFGLQGNCNGSSGTPFPDDDDLLQEFLVDCLPNCSLSGLEPGVYEVLYDADESVTTPGMSYVPHSYLFTIPEAPSIATAASTTNSVILSGSATAGDTVRIVRPNGTQLCSTTANTGGAWACQFPKSSTSSARAISVDGPSGGMSAYSTARTIPVTPPATPIETLPEPFLVSWFLNFDGDFMNLKPGDSFTINVSGMPEGTEIEVWMHSTPRLLGTATGTGAPMSMDLTVPADIENGEHEIEMIAVTPLGTNYFFTSDAIVSGGTDAVAEDDQVEPTASPEEPGAGSGNGSGSGNRADPAAPSALTESVATIERIAANPVSIAVAGGLALALLVLVALPTELLNNALSSNTSRLGRAYGVIDRAFIRAQDWFLKVTRSRALAAALLVSLVALIYGFVDPNFGFDIVSLRLTLSLALAFFILSYGASWLSGFVTRRLWNVTNVVVLQPSILIFAILGVILARILDFSPGFLVGVAIGLELIAASKRVAARVVMVQFGFVVGFALVAWVAYSLFTPGPDFLGMLTEDMLVAVTAEGLTGALIAIFPLQFLDGRELWEDSKLRWSVTFLVVATAFSLLVLPTALEGTDVGDYGTWVAVLAAFGALSLGAWFFFARAARKEALAERAKVDA